MTDRQYAADKGFDPWPLVVAAFLAVMLLSGGISGVAPPMIYVHAGVAIALAAAALTRLYLHGFPTRLAVWGAWIALAALALVFIQLIPLPPALWQTIPGHEWALSSLKMAGTAPGWMPLTLSPEATRQSALCMLPPVAVFLAALTLRARNANVVAAVVVACALISAVLALGQFYRGDDALLYLYEPGRGTGTGTFNNRNFFAAQIYSSLPLLGYLAGTTLRHRRIHWALVAVLTLLAGFLLLTGLSVSASRSGIILAMPALIAALIAARGNAASSRSPLLLFGAGALIVGLLVIAQASMVGFLRLAEPNLDGGVRETIWATSLGLLRSHLALGTGLGSFEAIYQTVETPAGLQDAFINHAHNDWLELAIETGIPGLLLMVAFLIWLAAMALRVWWRSGSANSAAIQRSASLVLPLLLMHGLVDYPLRTPALLTLFALCCGLCCLQPQALHATLRPARGQDPAKDRELPPRAFTPAPGAFHLDRHQALQ